MWDNLRYPAYLLFVGALLLGIEGNATGDKTESTSTRIHRGFTARRSDYLFTAWIQTGTKTYHCAASLVSDEWVMTAASCVEDRVLENYKIYLGDYKIRKEDGEIQVDPDRIVLHPNYQKGLVGNDVAMIHLATKVDLEQATVTSLDSMFDGNMTMDDLGRQECLICGWGKRKNGKLNKRKQFLPVKIEDGSKCSNQTTFDDNSCICFTGDPGAPCQADRGSPIVCLINDVWTQLGVQTDGSCEPGNHFGAKISAVRGWLDAVALGIDCPEPPSVPNGMYFQVDGGNGNDIIAKLTCNDEYKPASTNPGDLIITCLDNNQWSSSLTTCILDSQGCPDPPAVQNGDFVPFQDGNGKTKALLVCKENFKPSSDDIIIECLETGQWSSSTVTCVSDSQGCPDPTAVQNGDFVPFQDGDGKTKAILVCDANFKPSSDDTIIECLETGQWSSSTVTCVSDSQGCSDPPAVQNGKFLPFQDGNGKTKAVLKCDANFKPSSDDTIIECLETGQWSSSTVTCVSDSQGCPDPPTVQNGDFVPFQDGDGKTKAILVCKENFKPSSDDIIIECLETGQWSSSTVTCVRDSQDCPAPPSIPNGKYYEVSNTGDERRAILRCIEGYSPSSNDVQIVCQSNGQWSTSSTVCEQDDTGCPDPPTVQNGDFVPFQDGDGKTKAILVCKANFKPSSDDTIIECLETGQWSSSTVTCVSDSQGCPDPPAVQNGKFLPFQDGDGKAKAVLKCDANFKPSSDDIIIECLETGQWSSSTVTCVSDSQGCSSKGTSFMFGFPHNYNGVGVPYMYTITTEPVTVTVTVPFISSVKSYSFTRAAIWYFDKRIFGGRYEELTNKGIEVKSTKPITVFAHQYESSNGLSAEGTLVFPEACASTEYIAVTHNKSPGSTYKSNLMIIGTQDDTTVQLQLPNGNKRQVTLGRYGTYHYASQDLSGAVVTASAKVVVMAGHECANVPNNVGWCDHLLEQLPPLASLQSTYILTYMKPRPHYSLRIVAPYSNTVVNIWDRKGNLLETVNLGSTSTYFNNVFYSQTISVTANKGILLAQYGHGTFSDNLGYGDPSMVIHPSLNQFLNSYYLFCPTDFYKKNWVVVTIKATYATSGLRLNNNPLTGKNQYLSVSVPGYGDYKVIHIRLYEKVNLLTHTDGNVKFGAWQYGFNSAVEYSWIAGRIV